MTKACAPNEINRAIKLARITFNLFQNACKNDTDMAGFVATSPFNNLSQLYEFMLTASVLSKEPEELVKFYNINLKAANAMFDSAARIMTGMMYDEATPVEPKNEPSGEMSEDKIKDAIKAAITSVIAKKMAIKLVPDEEKRPEFIKTFEGIIGGIFNKAVHSQGYEVDVKTGEITELTKEQHDEAMAMLAAQIKKESGSA